MGFAAALKDLLRPNTWKDGQALELASYYWYPPPKKKTPVSKFLPLCKEPTNDFGEHFYPVQSARDFMVKYIQEAKFDLYFMRTVNKSQTS